MTDIITALVAFESFSSRDRNAGVGRCVPGPTLIAQRQCRMNRCFSHLIKHFFFFFFFFFFFKLNNNKFHQTAHILDRESPNLLRSTPDDRSRQCQRYYQASVPETSGGEHAVGSNRYDHWTRDRRSNGRGRCDETTCSMTMRSMSKSWWAPATVVLSAMCAAMATTLRFSWACDCSALDKT
jgi:hypothetical protein